LGVFLPIDRQCIVTRSLQKGSFNIGREEGDGSAQRGRSVIYDCVVGSCIFIWLWQVLLFSTVI